MIKYTVYNGATGLILRSGEAQASTLSHLATGPNEAVTFGEYDPETHFFKNGQPALRPIIPQADVTDTGLSFVGDIPSGATISVSSDFVDFEAEITSNEIFFPVPEAFKVSISGPWPLSGYEMDIHPKGGDAPEGSMVVPPSVEAMQSYFLPALYAKGEELVTAMLGSPDESTRRRWLLKRSIFDRSLAGTLTDGDRAALAEGVRYTGGTIEDELADIGEKVAFENWVTFRADGVREESSRQVAEAKDAATVLAAIAWAEIESGKAVAEAQALLAG